MKAADESRLDLFAVGNAIVDVVASVDDEFLAAHDIVKGSMRLVSHEESRALYAEIPPALEISGGSAANVASGIASLGGRAAFAGRLGRDQMGEIFLHDLRAQGIAAAVSQDASEPTGRCLVLVTPDAQRSMHTHLGAAARFAEADLRVPAAGDAMKRAAITLLEGYVWASPHGAEILATLSSAAREHGGRIALSLPNTEAIAAGRDQLHAALGDSIDIVFGNEEEMLALYGVSDFAQAKQAAGGHAYLAVLTRSEKGSWLIQGGEAWEVPAHPANAIDSTGAGDLYAAGMLYGLARGWEPPKCGGLASRVAAHIVSQHGGRPRAPLAPLLQAA